MKNLKLYGSLLWMKFKCLKATEPLGGDNLLFTTQFPRGPGNHLINFNWMKGWNDLDLESGILYWESSVSTIRIIVKARPILNVNVQLLQILNKFCIIRQQ